MDSSLHPVVEELLEQRGISADKRDAFLNPDYTTGVHDPFLFLKMKEVCARLMKAMEGGESVVVHGDYDADGICGSAVVVSALSEVAKRAGWNDFLESLQTYLPHREGDGYGMSLGAVETFKEKNVDLIITVDCGISNVAEIEAAYEAGMEVIVVDHHQLPQVLSDKALSIHPLAPGEDYPFKSLAAVGVAYKLATALYATAREAGVHIPDGYEKWLLDFVAIATVTDMVPLLGENRVLETFGLRVLGQTRRPGLRALSDLARVSSPVVTQDVGFRIGPRINAPGRVASADVALRLMLSEDKEEAESLAHELDTINRERQRLTESATRQAMKQIQVDSSFIAVVHDEIRIGIAGLVANKISQKTRKPAVVMTKVGDNFVGSGRAQSGFHFVEAMDSCREHMIRGGGHPQAAGFTIAPDSLNMWIESMTKFATASASLVKEEVVDVEFDMEVALDAVDLNLVKDLNRMEPFGIGNPAPLFLASSQSILAIERVGAKGQHARVSIATPSKKVIQCIWFSVGDAIESYKMGDAVSVYYSISEQTFRGNRSVQFTIKDLVKEG